MKWRSLNLEPDLGDLEPAYNRHFIQFDVAQVRLALVVFNLFSIYLIRTDYGFFGFSPLFYATLYARILLLAFSALVFFQVGKTTSPRAQARWIAALFLWGILTSQFIHFTRPHDYLGFIPFSNLILFCLYLLLPLPLPGRVSLAALYTLLDFVNLNIRGLGLAEWRTAAMTSVMANLLGLFVSILIHANRRNNFLMLHKEKQANQVLQQLAMVDPLTSVKNRRMFLEQGLAEIERSHRHGQALTLAMIDLDQFKQVNDTLGHLAGDEVLQRFAGLMDSHTRRQDLFARLGGDEFGLLMPETGMDEAREVVERLIQTCQATDFQAGGRPVQVRMSVGLAHVRPGLSFEALMLQADQALYNAKRSGGSHAVWGQVQQVN